MPPAVRWFMTLWIYRAGDTGTAQIEIVGNAPPSGGVLSVDPPSGVQFETIFTFMQVGWGDDAQDLPLTYGFEYAEDDLVASDDSCNVGSYNPLSAMSFYTHHKEKVSLLPL